MVEHFLCLVSFGLHLKITPWFPKLHGVMEADYLGLLAELVWKVSSIEVSFFRDKQNLCNGLKRDCSMVHYLEGTWDT